MGNQLQVHYQDNEVLLASYGEMLINIIVGVFNAAHIDRVEAIRSRVLAMSPNKKVLSVTLGKAPLFRMDKELQTKLSGLLERTKDSTTASATVVPGTGLVAGSIRALITALLVVSRTQHPNKIFASNAEAVQWLLQYSHTSWTPAERTDCVRQVVALDLEMAKARTAA